MTKDKDLHSRRKTEIKKMLVDLSTKKVMGIINMTNDSFYDGNKNNTIKKALLKTDQYIKEGADIIDFGGYSSRPGAKDISEEEEWNRLKKIIPIVNNEFPDIIISIDTFRSKIAKRAIENGAHIINDISGGDIDKNMFNIIADLQVPYILTHIQGTPQNMQEKPKYKCIQKDIIKYFQNKITSLKSIGVNNIIIDPGFGFGKTLYDNYKILNNLDFLHQFKLPILTGVSRKSMIYKLLETTPKEALNGTSIINTICLQKGANILRVHDVKEAVECIKIIKFAKNHE